jgi:hypothetical protein
MNTSRATVAIAIIFLAAALTLAGAPQQNGDNAAQSPRDPSVPSASEAFKQSESKGLSQGNVEDLAY